MQDEIDFTQEGPAHRADFVGLKGAAEAQAQQEHPFPHVETPLLPPAEDFAVATLRVVNGEVGVNAAAVPIMTEMAVTRDAVRRTILLD